MKNGAKMKKTAPRKSENDCFSCSYARVDRAGRLLLFFNPVKGVWLIIKGSP